MKVSSICQPHFFPWIGYFNMIDNSDEFIFLDNVQYNRRSWQNRTYIKEFKSGKKKWISMSLVDSSRSLKINEIYIYKENLTHLKNQMYQNYKNTKYFDKYFEFFSSIFAKNLDKDLSSINIEIIKEICSFLGIKLKYKLSSSFNVFEKKEKLILQLLKKNNSSNYLANSGSVNYANEDFFITNKIKMKPHNYVQSSYVQSKNKKNDVFLEGLSIIDVIFNIGDKASILAKKQKIKFHEDII